MNSEDNNLSTSPVKKKNNILLILGIEFLILVVFAAIVYLVLSHFRLIPSFGINSLDISRNEEKNGVIVIESKIPGHNIRIENENELLDTLKKEGLFTKIQEVQQGGEGVPTLKLEFSKVAPIDGLIPAQLLSQSDTFIQSLGVLKERELNVRFFLTEEQINTFPQDNLMRSLLERMYSAVGITLEIEERERVLKEINKKNIRFENY